MSPADTVLDRLLVVVANTIAAALDNPAVLVAREGDPGANLARSPACVIAQPALIYKESLPEHEPPALVFDVLLTILLGGAAPAQVYPLLEILLPALAGLEHGLGRPGVLALAHQTAAPLPSNPNAFASYIIRYPSGGRERFRTTVHPPPSALPLAWFHLSLETEILLPISAG